MQYFRSLELSMETFPVGAGDVLSVVCEKHELMAVFWLYLRINNTVET